MIELGHVTDRKPPFRYAALSRVAFSDTDAQGVVYYGRYMPYFDLARTEYHRHLGRVTLDNVAYRVDDDGDTLMATAKATLVCIALDERKAVEVPAAFRERIASFEA